jgi:hypothetical protein
MFGAVDLGVANDRQRARCEQAAQIAITALGDATELFLPPLEFCFGTNPIQAEKSRPDSTACASDDALDLPLRGGKAALAQSSRDRSTSSGLPSIPGTISIDSRMDAKCQYRLRASATKVREQISGNSVN